MGSKGSIGYSKRTSGWRFLFRSRDVEEMLCGFLCPQRMWRIFWTSMCFGLFYLLFHSLFLFPPIFHFLFSSLFFRLKINSKGLYQMKMWEWCGQILWIFISHGTSLVFWMVCFKFFHPIIHKQIEFNYLFWRVSIQKNPVQGKIHPPKPTPSCRTHHLSSRITTK